MTTSSSVAQLCKVCSELNTRYLEYPLHPCRNVGTCWEASIDRGHVDGYLGLGSVEEIKNRRLVCDLCKLVSECLDKEPPGLTGECRITETEQFCRFILPGHVKARDPSVTHFHLTQASVIFDTSLMDEFQGPTLPWEVKKKDEQSSHYLMSLQTKASASRKTNLSSVSPQTEQEFLAAIGGQHVGTQLNPQLVRSWLDQCESEHGNDCAPSAHFLEERNREPAFVIDVIKACLVEPPSHCRYVALSYVWGKAAVFRHLVENTQSLRKPGSLRSLPIPATIQDAITLVQAIGEYYLWVDSLCIIQDDLRMQQTEIRRMGSIYSGALFTIIAAGGDHANSGLPGIKPDSREQAQKLLRLSNCELLTVIDVRTPNNSIDDSVWAQRGWTFQERVLSNRVLVFSTTQAYWTCRLTSHSEERALGETRALERLHLPFSQSQKTDYISWKSLPPLKYCETYSDLLYSYRQRYLSYQTDILNAFSGVTEMLGALQGDKSFWGLPESFFSRALAWVMVGPSSRNHVNVPVLHNDGSKEVPIPSWTWAAWSGKSSTHLEIVDIYQNYIDPLIQFSIVNDECRLVEINEQSLDRSSDRIRALSQNAQLPHQLPSIQDPSNLQTGHLHFWTSHATVKVVRRRRIGARGITYQLFPILYLDDAIDEIVDEEFIVVAGRGPSSLKLLAIEWKDEVAYRIGSMEILDAVWAQIENRRWRLITLG